MCNTIERTVEELPAQEDKILTAVMQKAIANGYRLPYIKHYDHVHPKPMAWRISRGHLIVLCQDKKPYKVKGPSTRYKEYTYRISKSLEEWAFDPYFAMAHWGCEEVDRHGNNLTGLMVKFKQIAVEYGDKLYSVNEDAHSWQTYRSDWSENDPIDESQFKRVAIELRNMYRMINVQTHMPESIEWRGTIQAYKYHLQKMSIHTVVGDNRVVDYLRRFIPPLGTMHDIDSSKFRSLHLDHEDSHTWASTSKEKQQTDSL